MGLQERGQARQVGRAVGSESDPLQAQSHVALDRLEGGESSSRGQQSLHLHPAIAVYGARGGGEFRELALVLLEKGVVVSNRLLLRGGLRDVLLGVMGRRRKDVEGVEGGMLQGQSFEDLHLLLPACDGAGARLDTSGVRLDGTQLSRLLFFECVDGGYTAPELHVEFCTALWFIGTCFSVHDSIPPSLS